jgi:2-keto-4-pentenoate hydratase/2-oxohepta-3-ene-1,7-dioic acid hydratase in catechol pathway
MKVIRCVDNSGHTLLAEERADGSTWELDGELFSTLTPTNRPVQVRKLLAPLEPRAIFCIGLNYRQHAEETKAKIPSWPVLFMKSPGAVQHPGEPIELPEHLASTQVDYECELAVVIGRKCKNVSREDALQYVFGYTCANDISARDWQKEFGGSQWCRGKTFDTFCPLGPALVTRDDVPNPHALRIRTLLNGETMQDSSTDDMIFDIPTLIAFLSGSTTLLPGTVILTGTPQGVGMARTPQRFLQSGDTVSVVIDSLGTLTNPVIREGTGP